MIFNEFVTHLTVDLAENIQHILLAKFNLQNLTIGFHTPILYIHDLRNLRGTSLRVLLREHLTSLCSFENHMRLFRIKGFFLILAGIDTRGGGGGT